MELEFKSAKELLDLCAKSGLSISGVMRERECQLGETTPEAVNQRMARAWKIMQDSARQPLQSPVKSMGGLIGGEAKKLELHRAGGSGICGDLLQKAITYAMAVLEVNASMGLIVAAPTAGSAGVVPGLMLAMKEHYSLSDDKIIEALFNAGAVGYLAMRNATVAGAVGGCQAEIGVASAMAASAAVELMGRHPCAISGCCFHRTDEYAGPCVRPGGRFGGISLPEPQCGRCGQCTDRRRAFAERHSPADPV